MSINKLIHLVSSEEIILKTAMLKLQYFTAYSICSTQWAQPIPEIVKNLDRLCKVGNRTCDLIVLFGKFGDAAELYSFVEQAGNVLSGIGTKLLLVVEKVPTGVPMAAAGAHVRVISYGTYSDDGRLRNTVDLLLGVTSVDCDDRVAISDEQAYDDSKASVPIPSNLALILDTLRSAHFFLKDEEFRKVSVPYGSANSCNFEEDADKSLDNEYRHVESLEEFHKILTENDQRVTYFLMGHRGVGKTSFMHYYFRIYQPFVQLKYPFVIIEFKNYGYVGMPHSGGIDYKIISALFTYYTNKKIRPLQEEYPNPNDLWYPAHVEQVVDYCAANGVPFGELIPESLQYDICGAIEENGQINVGKELSVVGSDPDDNRAVGCFYDALRTEPYRWIREVWSYIHRHSAEKPFVWFARWLIEKAFDSTGKISYASHNLFNEKMSDWRQRYLDADGCLKSRGSEDLEKAVVSFINRVILEFGRLHVVFDNIDQLHPSLAEYEMIENIYPHLAMQYDRLKLILSFRPSTYSAVRSLEERLRNDAQKYQLAVEDAAIYHRFWLRKVSIRTILEQRLRYQETKHDRPEDRAYIDSIRELLAAPLLSASQCNRPPRDLAELITGLSGNSIRDGLNLFHEMLRSRHVTLTGFGGNSLLRKPKTGRLLVADHVAIRGLCLENGSGYSFRPGVINLFHCPGVEGYRSMLVQARVMEILLAQPVTTMGLFYQLLIPLGYEEKEIERALRELQRGRLISFNPDDASTASDGQAKAILRYRGRFYYEVLITRLSYIQLAYFTTPLPRRFADKLSYPSVPTVQDLDLLVENFLSALWADIKCEREHAKEGGIARYGGFVKQGVEGLHNQVFMAVADLERVWKRIHRTGMYS